MPDIDTGDTVRHIPSDESWIVAFVEGGKLCACGWPCSLEPLSDFALVRKAPLAERLQLLNDMASMKSSDPRREYAQRALRAATSSDEAATSEDASDALQDLHNELYRAQTTNSPDVLAKAIGKARILLSRYRATIATSPAAIPAPGDPLALGQAVARWTGGEYTAYRTDNGEPEQWLKVSVERLGFAIAALAAIPAAPMSGEALGAAEVQAIHSLPYVRDCLLRYARRPCDDEAAAVVKAIATQIAALAQPAPTYRDSTPELHVGNSSFEDWFQAHPKACSGDKQLARDAYAAGMGDPLVCAKAAPVQQETDAAPAADAPPLKGLAHFHYRLEAASGYEQEGVYNNITADGFGRVIAALEGAREDGRAALQPTQGEAPKAWPKARDVGRIGDMSPTASMRVGLDSDNDVYVAVYGDDGGGSVEFCTPGSGGGQSPRVREALITLMTAMEEENATSPSRDWWARRIGKPTQGKDAAS